MKMQTGLAGLALMLLAGCGGGGVDSYETFMDKCTPLAQMLEQQGGTSKSLLSSTSAAAACECAWDKYSTDYSYAQQNRPGAVRASVSACLAELAMEPE